MQRRAFLSLAAGAALNVRDKGAAGDGARLDTAPIQAAIDACAQAGGGTVLFPAGRYLCGTLVLKDRVTLHLDSGAVLLGSPNLADYPSHVPAVRSYTDNYTEKSLIYAENARETGIAGRGVIDGQGKAFQGPYKVRPYMLRFITCRNVTLSDVTIQNSPMWVQHFLHCDEVQLRGLRVNSRVNANNDGIDIDGCDRVTISDCDIWSGDDAIVLKSTSARPARNVAISNCVLSSACNALKLGTETNGGFENISISNCTIYDTRLAGLALEMVDGGLLDRVTVSNVAMHNTGAPIFIRLGNRARPFREGGERPGMGRLRNVRIANVEATGGSRVGCALAGLPEHPIENVTLENIRLRFNGGGTRADAAREIPENPEKYPEYNMFGVLPAYGLYCRHARNLRLRNIETSFEGSEERPALVCDDVESLEIHASQLVAGARLSETRDAFIQGCRGFALALAGDRTGRVTVIANQLERAIEGATRERVFQAANRV